jgi:hypothetical protein
MSCIDNSHYECCGLCAKFRCREGIEHADFEDLAEELAAVCPYYQLQQSLAKLLLVPEPGQLRRDISWKPLRWNQSGYMAEVKPFYHGPEHWDVYLEPGESKGSSSVPSIFLHADG